MGEVSPSLRSKPGQEPAPDLFRGYPLRRTELIEVYGASDVGPVTPRLFLYLCI